MPITTNIAIHTGIPQPVNGIIDPVPIKQTVAIYMGLTISIDTKKNGKLIDVSPAIIHKISSGKNGKSCMITNRAFPFLPINFVYFSIAPSPTHQTTNFLPANRPMIKAINEPIMTLIYEIINVFNAPNTATPASIKIRAGIGNITTFRTVSKA